jgi:Ca-activated chloride channel family protein
MIRFLSPWWLLAVLPVLAGAGVYIWRQLHRKVFAVRFSNVELLRAVAPGGIGTLRRYAPAVALVASLFILALAMARPSIDTKEPLERATVMLALDVSLSMQAQDVAPNRIVAAQQAAKDFVGELPKEFNIGLVAFAKSANVVVSPTKDHASVVSAIEGLQLQEATATGEAVFSCLDAISTVPGCSTGADRAALGRVPHVRPVG